MEPISSTAMNLGAFIVIAGEEAHTPPTRNQKINLVSKTDEKNFMADKSLLQRIAKNPSSLIFLQQL
jgi:hypothetical protein